MSEMKLIMESWRTFCLTEEEGPKYKEDPEDTVALLDKMVHEPDPEKKEIVAQKIATDKDIAPILGALEELFQQLESEEIEEGIEQTYDDLGIGVAGAALGAGAKISDFLEKSAAGRILKKASGPLLGLALLALIVQQPGEGGKSLNKSAAAIAQLIASPDPTKILVGATDLVMDVVTESLRERKKT